MNFDQSSQNEVENLHSIDLTNENFVQEVIEKSKSTPVIVDFWAPWCEPCKQIGPILDKLVASSNGRVVLTKMNIDDYPEMLEISESEVLPAFYIFQNQKLKNKSIGFKGLKKLDSFVSETLEAKT